MHDNPIPTLPPTSSAADVTDAVNEVGAAIVADLVPADVLDRIIDDLEPWSRSTTAGSKSDDPEWELFHGTRTVRLNGLAAKSPAFVDLAVDPHLVDWAERSLIPDGGAIQINDTQLISIGPGEVAQYLHRDQTGWPWFNQYLPDGPEITVIAMVAVTDFTEANGATRVVPYSHRQPDALELFEHEASVPAEMAAGSVLFFSGRTIHGGGANTTERARSAIHLSYLLGWLRSEEAHSLAIPVETARTWPAKARELFGFAKYDPAPNPGARLWLVDFEDPQRLLDAGHRASVAHHHPPLERISPEPRIRMEGPIR